MVEGKEAIEQVTSPSDFSYEELVHMIAKLQADIEARDILIASLQCEQSFFLVDEAKRHRYFLEKAFEIDFNDPFLALQRDSRFLQTSSNSLNRDVKHEIRSDIKEVCLGELIDAHKHVHAFFREQLLLAEERYAALCSTFEEERKRLERDAAQGDDVVAMLEKEREKLQIELENERTQNKRLEKELKRALDNYNNQKALTQRQRMVAAQIIKEKRRISKEFLAKCEQVEQLESKLGLKSAVLPDISSAGKAVSPSTTAKVPTCLRSPVEADASSSVEPSSRNQRSMSPPPKCRGSKNSPPPPPSPVIPPSKLDSGGCTVSPSSLVNGCFPPSSADGSLAVAKARSPPPVKTRPEPPVRRTPEYNAPTTPNTPLRKMSLLEVETDSEGVEAEDAKLAAAPSPPPPPPQMQLHYPYPGMQGNPHHPPVRSGRTFGSHFSGGGGGGTASSPFIGAKGHLRSPTSPPPASHQFPYAQRRLPTDGGSALRFGGGGGGLRKTPPVQQQQQQLRNPPATGYPVVTRPTVSSPRVVMAGRTGTTIQPAAAAAAATASSATGNLYINGK